MVHRATELDMREVTSHVHAHMPMADSSRNQHNIRQKPTQYCNTVILQLKINKC